MKVYEKLQQLEENEIYDELMRRMEQNPDVDPDVIAAEFEKELQGEEPKDLKEKINDEENYEGWDPEDVKLHKSIDWKSRNYDAYDTGEEITRAAYYYSETGHKVKDVPFHKYVGANNIFKPYWKPVENPFPGSVGPMYDGHSLGNYMIHDRYDSPELNDLLSR